MTVDNNFETDAETITYQITVTPPDCPYSTTTSPVIFDYVHSLETSCNNPIDPYTV